MQLIISGIIILAMIFVFVLDGDKSKIPFLNKGDKKNKENKNKKGNEKQTNKSFKSTQNKLPFKEIRSSGGLADKGLIIKEDASYIGVIEVYGINYNLLSVSEKLLLEEVFQMVLNGLDYPIQIHIQSKKMDIDNYTYIYEERMKELKDLLKNEESKLSFLHNNDNKEEEIKDVMRNLSRITSQITYGESVIEFIKEIAYNSDILDKKYYISTPYFYNKNNFNQEQTEDEKFQTAFNTISNRLNSILSGFSRGGLEGKMLNGLELAELLYTSYNKDYYSSYKLKNAIKSDFTSFVTTSRPIEYKILDNEKMKLQNLEKELKA